jgi:hypothetical protein
MNQNLPPEKHLIILWPNCESVRSELESTISQYLKVLSVTSGEWSESNAAANYSRFYQQNLFENNDIISHKGIGLFHIYVVLDSHPKYHFQETTSGYKFINSNIFKIKQKLRDLTFGGHKVHSTCSQEELRRDVALLWGIDALEVHDFERFIPNKINGTFGINGFADIDEVFLLLNCCTDYLVLRNYEEILKLKNSLYSDIDLLVSDVFQVQLILNAVPAFPENFRVHYKNMVNGREIFWDLRSPADGYMDFNWAIELRNSRTQIPIDKLNANVYGLVNLDYYYSLAYHVLIHKQEVSKCYFSKLSNLIGRYRSFNLNSTEVLINDVAQYMADRNFYVTKPLDSSIFFNEDNHTKIMSRKSAIQFQSFLKNVKAYVRNTTNLDIILSDNSYSECAQCRIKHFCVEFSLHDSKYSYYGTQLSNGKFILISPYNNLSIVDFFLLTKSKWNQGCRNCLELLSKLGITSIFSSSLSNKNGGLGTSIILLWSKEYSGSSIWQDSIFGLVRVSDQMQVISQLSGSHQDLRNFSVHPKQEFKLIESDALELCVNYLRLGLISGAANLFSTFYKLMSNEVESDHSAGQWRNIDLTMSNLVLMDDSFEWVDKEIFGASILPSQYIKLRCTLISIKLILQGDCSLESKEIFLSNIWEELIIQFLDVDFMKYLAYEFELQLSFRALDYKTFVDNEAYFFYNFVNKNFSHLMQISGLLNANFKNFEALAERDIAVAERDIAVAERDLILNSTVWKIFLPYRKVKSKFRKN